MKQADDPAAANTGFSWEGFQNRFFGDGLWKEALSSNDGTLPWVEDYVRNLISEIVPGAIESASPPERKSAFTGNVFETHELVIARIRLPGEDGGSGVRLLVAIHELIVEWPDGRKRTMKLPCFVRPDAAKAVWKEGVLEVRMPKEGAPKLREVPIQFR